MNKLLTGASLLLAMLLSACGDNGVRSPDFDSQLIDIIVEGPVRPPMEPTQSLEDQGIPDGESAMERLVQAVDEMSVLVAEDRSREPADAAQTEIERLCIMTPNRARPSAHGATYTRPGACSRADSQWRA